MHDALRKYEPDTIVEDVDDWQPEPIARGRVPTGDLEVHVQLDDGWHREDVEDATETACDVHVNERLVIDRRARRKIEHPLAPCECWTTKEKGKANDAYRAKYGRDYQP